MTNLSFQPTANVDGAITPADEARVPILDRGFLYGDSIYEVFRTYSGVPLFYDEHLDRLENSARLSHMQVSQSREELTEQIRKTIDASGASSGQDVYVRYQITRGSGPVDLYPAEHLTTRCVILVKEVPAWSPLSYSRGLRLAIPATRRNPTDALNPNIKGGNYLNNILALTEAVKLGADDCLILNHENLVTESSNSNVFFLLDGRLVTPGERSGNLNGITKGALRIACAAHDLEVFETDITAGELSKATECFVTSATREVMPVCSLKLQDGNLLEFPEGGGKTTNQVAQFYREYVQQYVAENDALRFIPA